MENKAKKLTAANTPFLAAVKRSMNAKVFAEAARLANTESTQAAEDYVGRFFRREYRQTAIDNLRAGQLAV